MSAVPAGMFTGHACVGGNFKHGIARVTADRGKRIGRRRGRAGAAIGSWSKASAAIVPEASGRHSERGRPYETPALCEKFDRRNEVADGANCDRIRFRLRSPIQRRLSKSLSPHADADSTAGAVREQSAAEPVCFSAPFSATIRLGRDAGISGEAGDPRSRNCAIRRVSAVYFRARPARIF